MLVADPRSSTNLPKIFNAVNQSVLIAIGPEGGWNDYEIEQMLHNGFKDFSMGPRILKVETAVTAIYAVISVLQSS